MIRSSFALAAVLLTLWCATSSAEQSAPRVDWNAGATQAIDGPCGPIPLAGIEDGKSYTLWVKSPASGTCSFNAEGLTFHYPPNYGPTTPGSGALFSFTRFDADVLVSWATGY